jgi:hypothetical protein
MRRYLLRLLIVVACGVDIVSLASESLSEIRVKAEKGVASAQFALGLMYAKGEDVPKDSVEAVKWYRKAAEQGDAFAEWDIGRMYRDGEGVPKDSAEAMKWFRKAAEQGIPPFLFDLGTMLADGKGVPKDSVEAVKWYRKAAEQGYPPAQCDLGAMYADGRGVPKDEIEALASVYIAAASGNRLATKNRELIERRLGQAGTLAAQQRSKEILKEIEAKKANRPSTTLPRSDVTEARDISPKKTGSGAIVSVDGYVVTAAHVVASAAKVSVVTESGTWPAQIVRIDNSNDVAILRISSGSHIPLPVVPPVGCGWGSRLQPLAFPTSTSKDSVRK